MARFLLVPVVLGGFLTLFWLWALFDVIRTNSASIRNLSKATWLLLVLLIPTLGAVAWVFFGRPEEVAVSPGDRAAYEANRNRSIPRSRPIGAEDSPGWTRPGSKPSRPSQIEDGESLAIRQRRLAKKEAELAKREAELRARENSVESRDATRPEQDGDTTDPV